MQENEVTQADREAAIEFADELYEHAENWMIPKMQRGSADSEPIIQAFARHRQQAEDAIIRAADKWLATQYGLSPLLADLARIRAATLSNDEA